MSNAVITGTGDLGALDHQVQGALVINGVSVTLASSSAEHVEKTINRFTVLTNVTASIAGATVESTAAVKHLVLTSPEEIRVSGDMKVMYDLGIEGGLTVVSTAAHAEPATTYGE